MRSFTKLDLAKAYVQSRIGEEDQYKTSFRVPGGQYKFRAGAFGLHSMSSLYAHIFGTESAGPTLHSTLPVGLARHRAPSVGLGPAQPMLGRFVQVYCDYILIFSESKTREEHLVHVRMVLETLRHYKL